MYRDEQLASSLAKVFDEYDYAMIDTCSMMEESFPSWMEIYEKSKKFSLQFHPLIVLKQCIQELKKHNKGEAKEKKRAAKLALEILKTAKKNKTIVIQAHKNRKKNSNFGDHAIFSKVNDDHLDFRILVITQDKSLTSDLLKLNDLFSQNGKPVDVMKLTPKGELVRNKGLIEPSFKSNPTKLTSIPTKKEHPLVISDRRLSAVIGNPNYPQDKKESDVRAQLSALSKTDPKIKRGLTLNYSEERLQNWLSSNVVKKPSNENKLVVRKEEPKPVAKPEPKPESKPQNKVERKPVAKVEAPKPASPVYEGKGRDAKEAVSAAALNAGIIIRDHGVPYIPIVHGPTDWTAKELQNLIQNYEKGGKKPFDFKNVHVEIALEEGKYKASLSFLLPQNPGAKKVDPKPKSEPKVKPEPKPQPKKEEAKKQEAKPAPAPKQAPKKAEPKPEAKKPEPKVAPAKKEAKQEPTKQASPKAKKVPKESKKSEPKKEPVLIVAVPDDPKVAAKIEKDAKSAKAPKKAEPKNPPKKEPAKKSAQPKKAESPKKEEKPAPKHPKLLAEAKTAETRLQAVLPNSTYSEENKVKDIRAQLALIAKLSKEERSELKLSQDQLQKALAEHSKPKGE